METIRLERDGDVLNVVIDHPRSAMNAVDATLHRELAELFALLKLEGEARAIVLTGAGKAFSAGGDMSWFPALRAPDRLHELRREAKQIIWDLLDVEVPIVCALNGSAVGLGASIALLCDVIVMADTRGDPRSARPGRARRRRRRRGDLAAAARPARRQAAPDARRTARRRRGAPARRRRRGVPGRRRRRDGARRGPTASPPSHRSRCRARRSPSTRRSSRRCSTSFDLSTALELGCFVSADHAEAVNAFVEKRPATFHGR